MDLYEVFLFGFLSQPIFLRRFTIIGVTDRDNDIRMGASSLWTVYAKTKSVEVFSIVSIWSFPPVHFCTKGIISIPLKLKIHVIGKITKDFFEMDFEK